MVSRSKSVWPLIVLNHLLSISDHTVVKTTGMGNLSSISLSIKWGGGRVNYLVIEFLVVKSSLHELAVLIIQ